ncbi:MAG: molybdenum cofactor guanylyltransferase [Dehalococcoidales bacterium]|nr:molybdenum cofactor guanylyltransferase [Dehalococcoidales bacterium]
MEIGGIVLAGGKGLRLGRDKLTETIGGRSLLQRVVSRLIPICQEIIIVTAEERVIPRLTSPVKLKMATDIVPGKGPLGGVYTGLTKSDYDCNVVVACDMPFLNEALLRYMVGLSSGVDIVVPRVGDKVEPLHAVYSRNCIPAIEGMLKEGRLSVYKLLNLVKVRYVDAGEIERFDPKHLSFFNVNTRTDIEKARDLAGGMAG